MPPLLDPDTVSHVLAAAEPSERDALAAELARVRERATASAASGEQLRLAEALVLALRRPARVRL